MQSVPAPPKFLNPTTSSHQQQQTDALLAHKSTHMAILVGVLGVCCGVSTLEEVLSTPSFEYREFESRSDGVRKASVVDDLDDAVFAVKLDDRRRGA